MNYTIILLIILSINSIFAYKVLLLTHLQGSHVQEAKVIGEELVSRGHLVYSIIPSISKHVKALQHVGIRVIAIPAAPDTLLMDSEKYNEIISKNSLASGSMSTKLETIKLAGKVTTTHCNLILENEIVLNELKDIDFDIAVVDGFVINLCLAIIPRLINIPFISSFGSISHWSVGIPALPSFVPNGMKNVNDKMTLSDKVTSLVMHIVQNSAYNPVFMGQELLTKYYPDINNWNELLRMTEFFIVFRDALMERPEPSMPNTLFLPGITYSQPKPLPKNMEDIYAKSETGVIIVSFGSTAGLLTYELLLKFLNAFKQMEKFSFIWKFPTKSSGLNNVDIPDNVYMFDWLPQNDCLGHNKTRLFITHCGNNGQYESLYHGVPMLGIPLFADQHHNAFRITDRGYGLSIDITSFETEDLVLKMNNILNNASYYENVQLSSSIMKDRPHPKEEAVFWIEHVIKFGGSHLRGISMDMPWYKLLMFDIWLFIMIVLLSIVLIVILACKLICRKGQKYKSA